jgi:type I restriction enzyme M protein
MAKRPVFSPIAIPPYFTDVETEFVFFPGFSVSQKQKCINSLHEQYLCKHPSQKILEISSKSENKLGVQLSAFNLMIKPCDGSKFSVEVAFQSSKVFEHGGPYEDMRSRSSREAKKDSRLKNSGKLQYFLYENRRFELFPTTFFYNWLYVNALSLHPELSSQVINYDAFTDIEFNPERSINCQARSAALFVSLYRRGLLDIALKDKESFLNTVYGNAINTTNNVKQLTLWD